MSSTYRQRFFNEPKECDLKFEFKGKVYLLQVCLNYEGSDNALPSCIQDGLRIKEVAKKAGVTEIECVYDDGSTPLFPSHENVAQIMADVCRKCKPGDYFVFQYSGHGNQVPDQDGDEESGMDQTLCLVNQETKEIQNLTDDQIAQIVSKNLDPKAFCLFMVDACHSGTILDTGKRSLWKGKRKVFCISGCQDKQCSQDTGDGGQMTNALLKIIKDKQLLKLRKERKVSIQQVFNRMVTEMPQEEGGEQQVLEQKGGQEQFEDEWVYQEDDGEGYPFDDENYDNEYEEMQYNEEPQPGQNINLSWCGGVDPTNVPFPF